MLSRLAINVNKRQDAVGPIWAFWLAIAVLRAMQGLAADLVRLSLGRETAAAGVTYTGAVMPEVVKRIDEVASERPGHTLGSLNEIGWEIGVDNGGLNRFWRGGGSCLWGGRLPRSDWGPAPREIGGRRRYGASSRCVIGSRIRVGSSDPGMAEIEFSLTRFAGAAARAAKIYVGARTLVAEDIAERIVWMASRPPHVCIDEVVIKPTDQAAFTRSTVGRNKGKGHPPHRVDGSAEGRCDPSALRGTDLFVRCGSCLRLTL